MNQLSLSFFGAFQAIKDGKPVTHFRSAKVQGLLIYLVVNAQQVHERDVLATLFWPDAPENVAKRNLRQSLYRLRRIVGDLDGENRPVLQITRNTVQFDPATNYQLDVVDFLHALETGDLQSAVALYTGELLPGFTCDSQPFDDWLRREREQLHRQALAALRTLANHSLTRAAFQAAERYARQQLQLEPWREAAYRQLMQALALQGERSAALAQLETCRSILAAELGVEPAAETLRLAERIRKGVGGQTERSVSQRRLAIPFVGRQQQFETLVAAYRQAANDGLQVVTLTGKAGIGKTRLTQQFLAWADTQGADILQSRAFATSAGLSYQPITQLLRQRIERENAPEDLLADLWLAQLTRLLPELRDRYPDLPAPTQQEDTARQHLFEAVTRVVQALAVRRPLLLFVDDWHWADTASLDVLHYAAVRWAEAGTPVLVVLTLRQEVVDESTALQSWLSRFQHGVKTVPLQLGELSPPETEQLIHHLLTPQSDSKTEQLSRFTDWLFSETDGQPLFLAETLKSLVADGLVVADAKSAAWQVDWDTFDAQLDNVSGRMLPEIEQILRGWLGRISAPARQLLMAAAVLAKEITFDRLCRTADLDQFAALTALDELLEKQLLLDVPSSSAAFDQAPHYSFSHQKVSDFVYAEAGTARQRLLHRQTFAVLQTEAAPAADCAFHALKGGLLAETIRYSLLAGQAAQAQFAHQVSLTHYQTAQQAVEQGGWPTTLSGADREALYRGLGRAYELVENWQMAQACYEGMVAYARTVKAPATECLGLNCLAALHLGVGLFDPPQANRLLAQAQQIAEQTNDQRGRAETALNLSRAARHFDDLDGVIRYSQQALEIARELGHPQLLASCLLMHAYAHLALRQWAEAHAYGKEAQERYKALGNGILAADAGRMAGSSLVHLGRARESRRLLQKELAFARQVENVWAEVEACRFLALAQLELGQYGEAVALAHEALTLAHAIGPPMPNVTLPIVAIVQRVTLSLAEAQATLLTLEQLKADGGFELFPDMTLAEQCAIHALAEEWEQAHTYAKQIAQFHAAGELPPMSTTSWFETEALLRGGDSELARAEVERAAKAIGRNRRFRVPHLRSQALLARWDEDLPQAIAHLESALRLAREMDLSGEEWPILGELGKLYAERGEQAKSQQAYQDAAAIIKQLGETIGDKELRERFLTAVPTRAVLEMSRAA